MPRPVSRFSPEGEIVYRRVRALAKQKRYLAAARLCVKMRWFGASVQYYRKAKQPLRGAREVRLADGGGSSISAELATWGKDYAQAAMDWLDAGVPDYALASLAKANRSRKRTK